MDITNKMRAEWAESGLREYENERNGAEPEADEKAQIAADLICDLMHLIQSLGCDAEEIAGIAIRNFENEQWEESEKTPSPGIENQNTIKEG